MSRTARLPAEVVIDACSLINLYAVDGSFAALHALGMTFLVPPQVSKEALYIHADGADRKSAGASPMDRVPVDLCKPISSGHLSVVQLTEQELARFVGFARLVGDGEAAACAVALARRLTILTDDRAAGRLVTGHGGTLIDTPALLKWWFRAAGVDGVRARQVLTAITERASYAPASGHPLRKWWEAVRAGDKASSTAQTGLRGGTFPGPSI